MDIQFVSHGINMLRFGTVTTNGYNPTTIVAKRVLECRIPMEEQRGRVRSTSRPGQDRNVGVTISVVKRKVWTSDFVLCFLSLKSSRLKNGWFEQVD